MMRTSPFALLCLCQATCALASGDGNNELVAVGSMDNASVELALRQRLQDLQRQYSEVHHADAHHGHQHDALLYLVLVMMIGTAILHLTTLPQFHKLPYTVVLFVLGMVSSLVYHVLESSGNLEEFGVFARSYEMWMAIDPHLLIFTMLPVLLTGDAMAIDTSVARRVSGQCLWLAGPGVLLGAFGTAFFLWVYLKWEFLLCLASGAILAATDPVAVVGLLKELGASPVLTVQIQGESLLNDGTAMVLFNVAYNMLKGDSHNVKSISILLVYMVGCAWFLGMVIGGVFASWIRAAGKRLEHHSNMIQISLTICCAYGSFVFAEGVVGVSGVLSTVAASLILAHTIWPKIVSHEAMHEVWHTFEYIGNTLIFFLAGALGGRSLWHVNPIDYLHLVVIYIMLLVLRGSIMLGSRPILRLLSPDRTPVTAADAIVMTWGGLRGAVGLALAIQLVRMKADGKIGDKEANQVFFFTAGIAFLTLIVNATTCPKLVTWLGIAATPKAKNKIMGDMVDRLQEMCDDKEGPVKDDVDAMLETIRHHINEAKAHISEPSSFARQFSGGFDGASKPAFEVVAEYQEAKGLFDVVPERNRQLLGWQYDAPLIKQQDNLIQLVLQGSHDPAMVRTVNESFLALVRAEIWSQIQRGEFVESTKSAEYLLNSNTKAFQKAGDGLSDYRDLQSQLGINTKFETKRSSRVSRSSFGSVRLSRLTGDGIQVQYDADTNSWFGRSVRLVNSVYFQSVIVFVIVCNAVAVFFDPGVDDEKTVTFLVVECCCMAAYLVDLVVKLIADRMDYFEDGWNALDFMCVCLGLFAIITTILVQVGVLSPDGISSEMLLVNLARVFKIMRVMRVVALAKFVREMQARMNNQDVCPDLAGRLETIFTLRGFVQAHLQSHNKFLQYFGSEKERCPHCGNKLMPDAVFCRKCGMERADNQVRSTMSTSAIEQDEHARCLLESWTAIYRAAVAFSVEALKVDSQGRWILQGLCNLRESVKVTMDLTNFVFGAAHDGVILAKDAEVILHPMMDHLRKTDVMFADAHKGIHSQELRRHCLTEEEEEVLEDVTKEDKPTPETDGYYTPDRLFSPSSNETPPLPLLNEDVTLLDRRSVSPSCTSIVSGPSPKGHDYNRKASLGSGSQQTDMPDMITDLWERKTSDISGPTEKPDTVDVSDGIESRLDTVWEDFEI